MRNTQAAQFAYNKNGQGSATPSGGHIGKFSLPVRGTLIDHWNYRQFIDRAFIMPVEVYLTVCALTRSKSQSKQPFIADLPSSRQLSQIVRCGYCLLITAVRSTLFFLLTAL